MARKRSMYTDEQWRWLNDRYKEGCPALMLSEFAKCHLNTMIYHWARMGLPVNRSTYTLDRTAFEALGWRES